MIKIRSLLLLMICLMLAGCFRATLPDLSGLPDRPPNFPDQQYLDLAAKGWSLLSVDQSLVKIQVFREGQLARLGHNHVISSTELNGLIAMDSNQQVRMNLFLPVVSLEVDLPQWREQAGEGFESKPSEKDIEGTRANMLSPKLLNIENFPFISISGESQLNQAEVTLKLGLLDQTHLKTVRLKTDARSDVISVSSEFKLKHSDFSISPFSVFNGALRVSDEINISIELDARFL